MLRKITLMATSTVAAFAMNSAGINLNNVDLEFNANLDVGQFNENVAPETTYIGIKFLNADNTHRLNDDFFYEASFLREGNIGNSGLKIGLSVKGNYTKDYATLPLGILVKYTLPFIDIVPVTVSLDVAYAPEVLSFNDAQKYFSDRIECSAEVVKNGSIVVGYRYIQTNYKDSRQKFVYNEAAYLGFNFKF